MGIDAHDDEEDRESGEAEIALHIVLASTRVTVVDDPGGEVTVARDLTELLIAVSEERRMVVVFDTRAPALDLDLFGRIARDFPSSVAILVRGGGDEARAQLYGAGVYRARCYAPSPSAACDAGDGPIVIEASDVIERVRRRLVVPATIPVASAG